MIQRPLILVVVCLCALASIGGFAVAGSEFTDTDLAHWIEALATVGALLAAVIAANYAAGAFRLEDQREKRRDKIDTQAQASLIAAWPADSPSKKAEQQLASMMELYPTGGAFVMIRNASNLPVTEVTVTLMRVVRVKGAASRSPVGSIEFDYLAPGLEPIQKYIEIERPGSGILAEDAVQSAGVAVKFTDASGQTWVRTSRGTLVKDPDADWG